MLKLTRSILHTGTMVVEICIIFVPQGPNQEKSYLPVN